MGAGASFVETLEGFRDARDPMDEQSIGEGVRGGLKAKIKGFRIELTLWMDCGKVGKD